MSWTDFLPRGYFSKVSKELYFMSYEQLKKLRQDKINKRDHSCTGRNDKLRLREDVWHLDTIIQAHENFNRSTN